MKNFKAKLIYIILTIILVISAFFVGMRYTIYNQTVTNANYEQGVYFIEINGQAHEYWYEN